MSKVVYLAERGCYEERYVSGVFDTPERAMAALHQEGWVWTRELWHFKSTSEVRHGGMESWENDQDWQDAIRITAVELTEEGPERPPDRIHSWDDGPSGTGFIEHDLTAEEADAIVGRAGS